MNPEQIKQRLVEKVSVTTQMVTYAKAFFLDNFQTDVSVLLNKLLENVEATKPEQVVIHRSVDTEGMVSQVAKSISWRLAGCEAIWGLLASNCLIPGTSDLLHDGTTIGWTTVVPGSGGQSAGWNLEQFSIPVPRKVLMRPSGVDPSERPLSDPDLYLHELGIGGLDKDIESSLRESVNCFKHELFLGCLALLGRASEGAWIELGLALASAVPQGSPMKGEKIKETMEDPFVGIGKKIMEVLKTYERKDVFNGVYRNSGYKPSDLKSCAVWSDAVRESRNSIHYGAKPAMSNSYEKVAALLIGAVPNLKVIYSIIRACLETKRNA